MLGSLILLGRASGVVWGREEAGQHRAVARAVAVGDQKETGRMEQNVDSLGTLSWA